jgi:hypothetical protein
VRGICGGSGVFAATYIINTIPYNYIPLIDNFQLSITFADFLHLDCSICLVSDMVSLHYSLFHQFNLVIGFDSYDWLEVNWRDGRVFSGGFRFCRIW